MAKTDRPGSTRERPGFIRVVCFRAALAGCLLSGVWVADAAAATGDLIQKPGAAGCLSVVGFCSPAVGLDGAQSITVSPDGRNAYVASVDSDAVVVFDRGGDGTLIQKPGRAGCISDTGAGRCRDGTALDFAKSVTVSPDGRNAYVASETSDAVAVFDRARDGRLVQKPGRSACISDTGAGPCADGTALDRADSVTVTPDGENAYVASEASDAVAVFDRAADGTLTQKPGTAGCISQTGAGPCTDGTGLDFATSVVVSPDGRSAYVASLLGDAVAIFDRSGDGTLTQKPGTAGCISATGGGRCRAGTALDGAVSVTVSPEGRSVYVSSRDSDAVAMFDRTRNGRLVQKPGEAGCISDTGAGPCLDGTALEDALAVTVSSDGLTAYVASDRSDALSVFDRAPNGTLAQRPGTAGCISDGGAGPCADGAGLDGALSVTLSPDGRNVYTASSPGNAVALFDREPSPLPPATIRPR